MVGGQVCADASHSAALRPHSSLFLAPTLRGSGAKPASLVQSSDTIPIKKPAQGRLFYWWVWLGSNQRPLRCQRSAHTTELHTRHRWLFFVYIMILFLASLFRFICDFICKNAVQTFITHYNRVNFGLTTVKTNEKISDFSPFCPGFLLSRLAVVDVLLVHF